MQFRPRLRLPSQDFRARTLSKLVLEIDLGAWSSPKRFTSITNVVFGEPDAKFAQEISHSGPAKHGTRAFEHDRRPLVQRTGVERLRQSLAEG